MARSKSAIVPLFLPLVFLSLFISLSFSSLVWRYDGDGPVVSKPLIYQNMVVVASENGAVSAFDPTTGNKRWTAQLDRSPNELFNFDNAIFASTTSGKLFKLDNAGKTVWVANLNTSAYNVSYVFGAAANQNLIFITADNGVYTVDRSGTSVSPLVKYNRSVSVTAPAVGSDFVVYGADNVLYKVKATKTVEWKTRLTSGSFWISRPVIDGTSIYVGALDNRLHAFALNGGMELWSIQTKGWVASTPLVKNGAIYFGSDDGSVYASDASGNLLWVAQTPLAVQTEPESGTMGGVPVLFFGGSDKNIYAISQDTGDIVWKGPATAAVGSPKFYQKTVFFGSQDRSIYAYSTERACSIITPREADLFGMKEVVVSGRYVSEAGGASVSVSVNGGSWEPATVNDSGWVHYIDPKSKFVAGLNTISCKVVDAAGEESGEEFTTVAITHDPTIKLSKLVITIPSSPVAETPFVIHVNDGDDGSGVDRFTITVGGKTLTSDKTIPLKLAEGTYPVTIKKAGFQDSNFKITVNPKGLSLAYAVAGAAIILVILWQVWVRVLSKKFSGKGKGPA